MAYAGLLALIKANLHPRYEIVMQYLELDRLLPNIDYFASILNYPCQLYEAIAETTTILTNAIVSSEFGVLKKYLFFMEKSYENYIVVNDKQQINFLDD